MCTPSHESELARVSASFVVPELSPARAVVTLAEEDAPAYQRWLTKNVVAHRDPALRIVTLSFKRLGQAPGDATAEQLELAANWPTTSAPVSCA